MLDMGAALTAVEVTIDRVTAIANSSLPTAEDEVHSSTKEFRSMPVTVADFGDVPMAKVLGEHHDAAHKVFSDTVDGVLADLKDFRAKLIECMHNHEATDDNAQAVLLSLGKSYKGHEYHAQQKYRDSRREQGTHLGKPEEAGQQDSGRQDSGKQDSGKQSPANATSGAPTGGPSTPRRTL